MPDLIKYESPVVKITWDEKSGLFVFKMKDINATYDEPEVIRQYEFFNKHSNNKPYKVLIDTRESPNLPTEEAFEYFFNNNNPHSKNAIIAKDLPFQILMSQMYKIRGVENCKLFKTEEEALKWILED